MNLSNDLPKLQSMNFSGIGNKMMDQFHQLNLLEQPNQRSSQNFNFPTVTEEIMKPKERQLYTEQNPICKSNMQILQKFIQNNSQRYISSTQEKKIINTENLHQFFENYIGKLSDKEKQQLNQFQQRQSKGINGDQKNIKNELKLISLLSDLYSRKYLVQIGSENRQISAVVLNINLKQLGVLILQNNNKVSSVDVLKEIINENVQDNWQIKFVKIEDFMFENISKIVNKVASMKMSSIFGRQYRIYSQFGYDLMIFKDYVCYAYKYIFKNELNAACINKQVKNIKQDKFSQETKQKIKQKSSQFKAILQLKYILSKNSSDQISDFLDKYKHYDHLKQELDIVLINYANQIKVLQIQQQKNQVLGVIESLILNLQPKKYRSKLFNQAFTFKNKKQQYLSKIESLNKIQLHKQKQLQQFFEIIKQNQYKFQYETLIRIANQVNLTPKKLQQQKQGIKYKRVSIFLKIREIMIYLMKYFKQKKSLPQLQYILQYLAGIGDQSSVNSLQDFILSSLQQPELYTIKLFQFYLAKKIVATSFDNCLFNHYINRLQQFEYEGQNIQKQKQLMMKIMIQIKQSLQKRQFEHFKLQQSQKYYKQYRQLIGNKKNAQEYNDILFILKEIYDKNILSFDKNKENEQIQKLLYSRNINKLKSRYLRLSLIKSHSYQICYANQDNKLQKIKQVILLLPATQRYGSLFWCMLCKVAGHAQNIEPILNNNYLQLLKEKPNDQSYSTDLVTVLQLFVKMSKDYTELEKLKCQLLILGTSKYLANVPKMVDLPNQQKIYYIRSFSELMFALIRQQIYELGKMIEKLCCAKLEIHLRHFESMLQQGYKVKQQQKQLYFYVKLLQITQLFVKSSKKDVIPILLTLLSLYPYKITLYYYYFKIKYSMNFKQRKQAKQIISINLQKILESADNNTQAVHKAIKMILNTQVIILEILTISPKQQISNGINILIKLSEITIKYSQLYFTDKTKLILFTMYQKIFPSPDSPDSQLYDKIEQIITDQFRARSDDILADKTHELPLIFMRVLLKNPFLCYPLLIIRRNSNFSALLNQQTMMRSLQRAIIIYDLKHLVLNKCRKQLIEEEWNLLKQRIATCTQQEKRNRYYAKAAVLQKKQLYYLKDKQLEQQTKKQEKQKQIKQQVNQDNQQIDIIEKKGKHFSYASKKLKIRLDKRVNNVKD